MSQSLLDRSREGRHSYEGEIISAPFFFHIRNSFCATDVAHSREGNGTVLDMIVGGLEVKMRGGKGGIWSGMRETYSDPSGDEIDLVEEEDEVLVCFSSRMCFRHCGNGYPWITGIENVDDDVGRVDDLVELTQIRWIDPCCRWARIDHE